MKIRTTILALFILAMASCSKDDTDPIIDPEPEPVEEPQEQSDGREVIPYFHENEAYYQPFVYRYDEDTQSWTKRIGAHFSTVSEETPHAIGFTQPYVEDSGVNLFQMVTLYQDYIGTNNNKVAGINAPAVLTFTPDVTAATLADSPEVHSKGKVNVIEQTIKIRKKTESETPEYLEIPISGEGTYDLNTGVIDLEVHFDETSIGGAAKVTRKYKISKTNLTL